MIKTSMILPVSSFVLFIAGGVVVLNVFEKTVLIITDALWILNALFNSNGMV